MKPIVYHIPVCPFSQRVEIQLELKGRRQDVDFVVVDITQPRPDWLLQKSAARRRCRSSNWPTGASSRKAWSCCSTSRTSSRSAAVAQRDPYRRAVENMLTRMEGDFCNQGYGWVMNQDPARRDAMDGGHAEAVREARTTSCCSIRLQAPSSSRTSAGPRRSSRRSSCASGSSSTTRTSSCRTDGRYARVQPLDRRLPRAPGRAAGQQGRNRQALLRLREGRRQRRLAAGTQQSSFTFTPDWRSRPWPPRNKYEHAANDGELGL